MKMYKFALRLFAKTSGVFFCRMATKTWPLAILLVTMFACISPNPPKRSYQGTTHETGKANASDTFGLYTLHGDSVAIPPFEIAIVLSPKAKERIINSGETIIVRIFLEGVPGDWSKVRLGDDGSFFVGDAEREIRYGQVAKFEELKFSKKIYDQLADKDVLLTVNVYTGRKTSRDNLIMGDFLSDKLSNLIRRHFTLHYRLIYGDEG